MTTNRAAMLTEMSCSASRNSLDIGLGPAESRHLVLNSTPPPAPRCRLSSPAPDVRASTVAWHDVRTAARFFRLRREQRRGGSPDPARAAAYA
jgi:hypothetical protein